MLIMSFFVSWFAGLHLHLVQIPSEQGSSSHDGLVIWCSGNPFCGGVIDLNLSPTT